MSPLLRVFDVCLALAGLAFAAPLLVIAVGLHHATSSGSAIFVQPRVGRHGEVFNCLKLRTMKPDTPQAATHEVSASAVTATGVFLRKTKIDELPQLWNVLKGEMSLVGPRPCLPSQTALIEARRRYGLDAIRPGITGPAQIRGIDMSDPERLAAADMVWLGQASVSRYFAVIIATAGGAGSGDKIVST
ncbi:MAG: sugar transferase [Brevundimonas sp.]|nr:MAG: sugar transferase [Brevundimonas sp.]